MEQTESKYYEEQGIQTIEYEPEVKKAETVSNLWRNTEWRAKVWEKDVITSY